jgi:hypothetical protein
MAATTTVGRYTVKGYSSFATGLSYTPTAGPSFGVAQSGNLYYFDTTVNSITENLTWTGSETISMGDIYAFVAGGGGGGGGGVENVGGGGGGAGQKHIFDITSSPLSPLRSPVKFNIGAGGAGGDGSASSGTATNGTAGGNTTFQGPTNPSPITFSGGSGGGDGSVNSGTGGIGGSGDGTGNGGNGGTSLGAGPSLVANDGQTITISGGDTVISAIYIAWGGGGGAQNTAGGAGGGTSSGGVGGGTTAAGPGLLGVGSFFNSITTYSNGGSGSSSVFSGGGGGGFGGGGGGGDGSIGTSGGSGADGAIFLFIVVRNVPSKPDDNSISYTSTINSFNIVGNSNGISNPLFLSATFSLYIDASGNTPAGSNSGTDSSADASGNYIATFNSGLTPNTTYWVKWYLTNNDGNGPESNPIAIQTASTLPSKPADESLTHTSTDTTIDLVGDTSGISNPTFTNATFTLYSDASGSIIVGSPVTITATAPDASGNYTAQFTSLTASANYWVRWLVGNGTGNGPASNPIPVSTVSAGGSVPSQPADISLTYSSTDSTIDVVGDTSGISNPTFTSATFTLYSDEAGTAMEEGSPVTINTAPDASGNYTAQFTGLAANTNFSVRWLVGNGTGNGPASNPIYVSTDVLADTPSQPPELIEVTKTTTTITVTGDSSTATDGPFSSAKFFFNLSDSAWDTAAAGSYEESGDIYTFTYTGLTPGTLYYLKWSLSNDNGDGPKSNYTMIETSSSSGNPPCFLRGSRILCLNKELKEEYMAIENMRVGTKVKILNGTYVKVHTIGKKTFINPDNADRGPNRLFRLTRKNYPELTQDLIITGCHSILVDKLLPQQKARHLQLMKSLYMTTGKFRLMSFIDEKAEPYLNPGEHEIWHFALENEEVVCNYGVYANGGLLVETASIKNMTEHSGLVPIE